MDKIVFLASADAMKPKVLIESYYACVQRDFTQDILLTDKAVGITYDMAKHLGMQIIITKDVRFTDLEWNISMFAESNLILVSCGWPYLIPKGLYEQFKAAINCHGSYLPDYRGSRAYMHYWANCSDYFGASIHYINEGFDDGNILIRAKQKIFMNESQDIIFYRTAELCGHLLPTALLMIESGHLGYKADGVKRYFYKKTPEEFLEHRKANEKRILNGENILLTKHKILE